MTRLSVIVPATDRPPTLDRCVEAIRAALDPGDELAVVTEPPRCHPGVARNDGVTRTTGDVLVFVDADVEVRDDALARLRTAFEADSTLAATFGSYDDDPGEDGTVSAFRNLLHHHVHHESPGEATTFWTGLGAVRRSAFEAVGGFDPGLRYLEDVDFGMRLAADGHRIVLQPEIQGKHLKRWSLWEMVRTDFVGRAIPWVELLLRHRQSTSALNLGWRHRLSGLSALVGAVALLSGRPRPALAAGAALVALNRGFYGLLLRRLGPAAAGVGVVLHALHLVVGIAAVPVALVRHVLARGAEARDP
jgi:glycosyltransferase involved in cell wall biosynthesis